MSGKRGAISLFGVIRDKQPDVVGTQELFQLQGDYIEKSCRNTCGLD